MFYLTKDWIGWAVAAAEWLSGCDLTGKKSVGWSRVSQWVQVSVLCGMLPRAAEEGGGRRREVLEIIKPVLQVVTSLTSLPLFLSFALQSRLGSSAQLSYGLMNYYME